MKNKSSKDNLSGKTLAIASAIGLAAVAVSLFAAYNATVNRFVPTGADTGESSWVFSSGSGSSDVPVQGSVSGVPIESRGSDKKDTKKPSSDSSSSKGSSEPAEEANKPIAAEIGNIIPVSGEISHMFSNGELVKSETLGVWKSHDGCDILCELGTDVRSMSEGTVKEIKDDPLWGIFVVIEQSNGLEVHYCGLAKELNVKAGQQVKQGEIIGKTADTNQAEILQKPHLHLGVKQGGKWIDPLSVVDKTE